jgi:tryptophan synthase beta subunit
MASVFIRKYSKVVDSKRVKKQSQKYYTRLTDAEIAIVEGHSQAD